MVRVGGWLVVVVVVVVVIRIWWLCDMVPFIRGSHQADASRLAAAVPGMQSPWLHAKACSSRIPEHLA